jgi:hypothetical protein
MYLFILAISFYLDNADIDCRFSLSRQLCIKKYVTQKSYSLFETVSRFKMDCFSLHTVKKNMRRDVEQTTAAFISKGGKNNVYT